MASSPFTNICEAVFPGSDRAGFAASSADSLLLPPLLPNGAAVQQPKAQDVATDGAGSVDAVLRALLAEVLGLAPSRVAGFESSTELFGALPEFDSMAVATLLTALEDRLHIVIEDDDVEAEDFMTYGRLLAFAQRKVAG